MSKDSTQGNGSFPAPLPKPCDPTTKGQSCPPTAVTCLETLQGVYGFPYCAANVSKDEGRLEHQLEDQRITDNCIKQLGLASPCCHWETFLRGLWAAQAPRAVGLSGRISGPTAGGGHHPPPCLGLRAERHATGSVARRGGRSR